MLPPRVIVLVGKDEEEAFCFHASAFFEQGFEQTRAQIDESFKQHIGVVKAFIRRQLVQEFEDRPFGR